MKLIAAIIIGLTLSTAVGAQTGVPQPPPQVENQRLTDEQRARLRADRDACRNEVKPQSLPRGERRGAMRRCIEARNPDMAPIFARGEARRAEMRQLRRECRGELRGKGLRGTERRSAMRTCFVSRKPELAKVFSCIDEARSRNMQPGSERRVFMRSCLRA